ncbi:uncharacterized protein TM35_000014910 [Trypanosoma theileri]|uniref:Uncharacterized protein n=1 Tax=Trypanosoma theileri TaxID=67003 RepID=A0A1X0P9L9_9TRYP|nr:uncharacterized protein TM35_000014910 [Trypanosoma theileri]ORC93614.1 hypothetical protein TM35_000014910 [Trypanosoma theileri]
MGVVDTFEPLFTVLLIFNTISAAAPLTFHRFAFYPLAFILFGLTSLLLLFAVILTVGDHSTVMYTVGYNGTFKPLPPFPRDVSMFLVLNTTMTTCMAAAVLAMLCWFCYECHRGWHVYILPMFDDLNTLEKSCWNSALDLSNRVLPT